MSFATNQAIPHWNSGQEIRVLVVDDEVVVAEQLARGLEACDIRTESVNNAADALARLAAEPAIGVVVTYLRTPGGSGQALAETILSQRAESAAVEVVMITGHPTAEAEAAALALRAGVVDLRRKPFRLAEAFQSVTRSMTRVAGRRAAAASRRPDAKRLDQLEPGRGMLRSDPDDLTRRMGATSGPASWSSAPGSSALSDALRSPAAAISSIAELLSLDKLSRDDEAEYQSMLRGGVERALRAVELIEEFHRLGRPVKEAPSRIHLASALGAALARMQAMAAPRRVGLTLMAPLDEVTVEGIASRLRQALAHAVGAVVEWCGEGSQVQASITRQVEACGEWAVVTLLAGPASGAQLPPPGLAFAAHEDAGGSAGARSQEALRFALARRIIRQHGGQVTSWNGEPGCMAIRLALRS